MGNRTHHNKLDPVVCGMREVALLLGDRKPRTARQIIAIMDGRGIAEDITRASIWFLIDRGDIVMFPDRRLGKGRLPLPT